MSELFQIDSIQKPKFRQRSGGNNSDESVTVNRVSDGVNIKALRLRLCRSNITRYLPLQVNDSLLPYTQRKTIHPISLKPSRRSRRRRVHETKREKEKERKKRKGEEEV